MVKYDRISHKTLQAFLDLINATIIDHLKILKDWFLIPWLIKMILICLLSPNDKKLPGKFKMKHIMKLLEHVMLPRSVLPSLCHSLPDLHHHQPLNNCCSHSTQIWNMYVSYEYTGWDEFGSSLMFFDRVMPL